MRRSHIGCGGFEPRHEAPNDGFYSVRKSDSGRWWVVGPDGRKVFLRGVDHANWNGHFCEALGVCPYNEEMKKRFADRGEWEAETLSRLYALPRKISGHRPRRIR